PDIRKVAAISFWDPACFSISLRAVSTRSATIVVIRWTSSTLSLRAISSLQPVHCFKVAEQAVGLGFKQVVVKEGESTRHPPWGAEFLRSVRALCRILGIRDSDRVACLALVIDDPIPFGGHLSSARSQHFLQLLRELLESDVFITFLLGS